MPDLFPATSRGPARPRLAFVVSHPIQYYAPLHRRLAQRDDVAIKVFFTWHDGSRAVRDEGFQKEVTWDIPVTEGYEFEAIPNRARNPGTHRFFGLRNPGLLGRLLAWQPDAVHVTGYAYRSHLQALRSLHHLGIPVLFRGDSHLLDERRTGLRWRLKRLLLQAVFRLPAAFLYVGQANRAYYEAFGVSSDRLFHCPHTIEVERFAEPNGQLEAQAAEWRKRLGIGPERWVLLFAGKFEDKKRPVTLMKAVQEITNSRLLLLMVGDGRLGDEVRSITQSAPDRFMVLPFQNQSRMPLVYRLADCVVLPSAYGETWGLAVNEALASGRPALVSDRVGCAQDLIRPGENGCVFRSDEWADFRVQLGTLMDVRWSERRDAIRAGATNFSTAAGESALIAALHNVILAV
jgi:glycosyltransferase involved in cell wall biosynthesis